MVPSPTYYTSHIKNKRKEYMHMWGDKDVDWEGLNKAIDIINKKLRFFRVPVQQSKEKFGTCRVYCRLGWNSLLDITHPGWSRYPYHKWLISLDIYVLSEIIPVLCNWFVMPVHKWAYRSAYKEACVKYPHLKEEICCMADYVELLDFYKNKRTIA